MKLDDAIKASKTAVALGGLIAAFDPANKASPGLMLDFHMNALRQHSPEVATDVALLLSAQRRRIMVQYELED